MAGVLLLISATNLYCPYFILFSELMTEDNEEVRAVIKSMEGEQNEVEILDLLLKTYRPECWSKEPFDEGEKEKLGVLFYMIMPVAVRSGNWSPQCFLEKGGSLDHLPYEGFVTRSDEAWALYLLRHHPPSLVQEQASEPNCGRGLGKRSGEGRVAGQKLKKTIDWYSSRMQQIEGEKETYMTRLEMGAKRRQLISSVCKIWYEREKSSETKKKRGRLLVKR